MDDIDVVADSEGEELGFALPKARRKDVSSIDTAEPNVSSGQMRPSSIITTTTSFVASLDALLNANVEENATGRPKPRPRPKFRTKEKGRAGTDASTSFIDTTTTTPHTQLEDDMDFPNILSIADRAKMRQRIAKQSSSLSYGQSEPYSRVSDDEDELSHSYHVPDGNEEFNNVLHNSKSKLKTKKNFLDDLELHESDPLGSAGKVIYEPGPTLSLQSLPRPYTPETRLEPQSPPAQTKPKPRPIKRSNKAKSSVTSGGAGAQHQPTSESFIPVATSPLPPSDPPLPFSSSHQHDTSNADHRKIRVYNDSFPPIESLPVPTSSPSSLFSAAVGDEGEDAHIAHATGHIRDSPSLEGDPLLMGPPLTVVKGASPVDKPDQITHITGTDINRTSPGLDENLRFMEPPSTFFKGASSLDNPSHPKPKDRKRKQREEQVEVIDLCTVPPKCTEHIVDLKAVDKKGTNTKGREKFDSLVPEISKTKGKSKRKSSDDDDFGIYAEDDGDDDYEDSAKRKKPKTKTKGKKAEGKLSTKPKKTVEVVVELPNLKRASKQKAAKLPSVDAEIEQPFAGTIADEEARPAMFRVSDEDSRPLGTPSRSMKELDPGSPVSPVPDSEGEDMQGLFDMEMAAAKSKGAPVTSTSAPGTGMKRRKRVVSDDEEEEAYGGKEEDEKAASPKKKAKTKGRHAQTQGKSKARTKGVVLSDDEEEEAYDGMQEDEKAASPKKKAKTKGKYAQTQGKSKARTKGVVLSDDGENHEPTSTIKGTTGRKSHEKRKASRVLSDTEGEANVVDNSIKENVRPHSSSVSSSASKPTSSSHAEIPFSPATSNKPDQVKNADANIDPSTKVANPQPTYTSLTSRYTIAPKTRSTPMSELIRRVNSKPLSPFASPGLHTKVKDANKSTSVSTPTRPSQGVTAYSPYLKASRSFLSKIAPLHPNRRTPPPPPPPPPPRKKSKKELELEEKWEEELIDSVGGAAAWSCLLEDERKEMKRHKWAVERGEIDD